jgi:AcrR family transcriptional regulator
MTFEQIAEAAVAVADELGLAAVSMEAVSRRLGCTKMALYRYVASRSDLVDVMFDSALGKPPPEVESRGDWRITMTTWGHALLGRYRAHPWAVDVPLGAGPLVRNQALWLESALEALAETPLPDPQKLNLVLLINGHVLFTAKLRRDVGDATPMPVDGALAAAMDHEVLPQLARVLEQGHLADGDENDSDFSWGLSCILGGADAAVALAAEHGRRGITRQVRQRRRSSDEGSNEPTGSGVDRQPSK